MIHIVVIITRVRQGLGIALKVDIVKAVAFDYIPRRVGALKAAVGALVYHMRRADKEHVFDFFILQELQ